MWKLARVVASISQCAHTPSLSSVIKLLSGVVQGSVIVPLLFLSYINELAEILKRAEVIIKLFADVKLYAEIVNDCDAAKLQYALNLLSEWAVICIN